MASHMEGEVLVQIDGVRENTAEYDDRAFLRSDEKLREAIADFLSTGARVENLAEVVAQVVKEEL